MCGSNAIQSASMITRALGTSQQMQAAKADALYQSKIAKQNASLAEAQAMQAGQAGSAEQSQIRERGRQVAGSQRAAYASSGIDVAGGSPLAVLADTAYQSEQDTQVSKYNTQLKMWGLQEQANNYRDQVKFAKQAGKNASNTALLTGLTTLAKQYSTFNSGNKNTKTKSNSSSITTPYSTQSNDYSGFNNYSVAKGKKIKSNTLYGNTWG